MNASYQIYPNGRILMFTTEGEQYENEQSKAYDENGGYPVSRHDSLEEALANRDEFGASWFGLEELPSIPTSIWDFYYTDEGWYCGNDSEGNAVFNHWTATVEYLRMHMCRQLTDREITEISISLSFGPTPMLTNEQKGHAFNAPKKSLVYAADCETTRDILITVLTTFSNKEDSSMNTMTIEEYNALVSEGRIINQPVGDHTAEAVTSVFHEEDNVEIYRRHNAVFIYWPSCGHAYTAHVR